MDSQDFSKGRNQFGSSSGQNSNGIRLWEIKTDLDEVSKLREPWSLKIRNKYNLKKKFKEMRGQGIDNLMVMADFDQTISKYYFPMSMQKERASRLGLDDQ